MSRPDVAEVGKTITYGITPPTGYTNTDHSYTWVINSITAYSRYGVQIPSSDFTVNNPGTNGQGTITFTPKQAHLDSFITFYVRFSDLGPHYCDSTIKRTLVVAPTPKPSFKFPASICLGDAVLFENTTTIHSGNSTYMWYFDDGDSSDLVSPVHEYKQPGTYNIRLIATSFPWGAIKDTTIQVEVGELPAVNFKVNNKCQGIAVTFQNQTTVGNGVLTYIWNFGDNTPNNTSTNPSHLYTNPGGYKVTLTAEANGCKSSLVKNAYTFAKPVANFNAPISSICARTEVLLPNTSTIALGQQGAYWTYGDGNVSTQINGDHKFEQPGTYTVKLLAVSEFDCKDSIAKQVTIKPTPVPDFSGDIYCAKTPTRFTNTTNEVLPNPVYQWKFSDNVTSSLKNITKNWPYEGPFNVKLTATYTNGCSDAIEKKVTVLSQPKANFVANDVCAGETVNFANLSTGDRANIQYRWDFGDGTFSTVPSPNKDYALGNTTQYTIALVATYVGACSDTIRKTLTVSESPICDFNAKDLGFLNAQFTPVNTSYSEYSWTFGEGGSSDDVSPIYKYKYTGNFIVTLKATNAAGCECTLTKKYSATTDIKNVNSDKGISIYPNPNGGTFTVTNKNGESMKVEVFNLLGVKVNTINSNDGSAEINLGNSAKGIYLVKVTIDGVTSTFKVTVTN